MCIYQFLIAVRQDGNLLQNEEGETTRFGTLELTDSAVQLNGSTVQNRRFHLLAPHFFSHLMGMFYRTIRMLENGIKPVYVFDGKPPQLKSSEVSPCSLWLPVVNVAMIAAVKF